MKRIRRLAVLAALVLGAAAGAVVPAALAQPAPSGSAKAGGAPKKGKPDDKADAGTAKGDAGTSSTDAGAELPEGHPPTGDLPPGHPPTGGTRRPQSQDPHNQFYQPPEDDLDADPSLPPGTIAFSLRDADDQPVASTPVVLSVVHSTVAQGESTRSLTRETDADGNVRFESLEVGNAVSYSISATRGPGKFETPRFMLDDKAGKKVSLHVFESTRSHDDLRLGMWGVVYLQLREDALVVEHHMTVLNVERVAWVPDGFLMTLPEGFKAFTVPDGLAIRFREVADQGAVLEGTVTPGQHDTMFRYQVPLSGAERQSISIKMPPKVFQIGIMAEASKKMGLEAVGFPAAQRTERNGRRVLVTKKQASGPGDEIASVDITLTGLPTKGPARWAAVGLAVSAVVMGFVYLKRHRDEGGVDPETRRDLIDAREALIEELVALERARGSGEVGPKSYERIRASLLDALARIVDQIEATRRRGGERRAA